MILPLNLRIIQAWYVVKKTAHVITPTPAPKKTILWQFYIYSLALGNCSRTFFSANGRVFSLFRLYEWAEKQSEKTTLGFLSAPAKLPKARGCCSKNGSWHRLGFSVIISYQNRGGVAQLVRAHGSYPCCQWFKSTRRYHCSTQKNLSIIDFREVFLLLTICY